MKTGLFIKPRIFVPSRTAFFLVLAGCSPQAVKEDPPAAEKPAEPPFKPLFNGKDLSGWVAVLDSPWTVEDGVLVARQNPAGRREGESWLLTETDYRDFILRLKFRITPGGNSGVFFHDPIPRPERLAAAQGAAPPWEAGYEVNINNDEPNYPTGSIWDIAKGPKGLQKEGEWNTLQIRVEKDKVWTWVNGRPALEGAALPPRPREARAGAIGLQRHGTPQYRDKVVEFKEIEIAELP